MMMKDTIVGGLVAGLVAGSIVAGALVMTRDGGGNGPVEVYGDVGINNGWSGSTYGPVKVEADITQSFKDAGNGFWGLPVTIEDSSVTVNADRNDPLPVYAP